jgi:hypothetical protein
MPPHRRKQPNTGSLHKDWCPATLVRCSKRAKGKILESAEIELTMGDAVEP